MATAFAFLGMLLVSMLVALLAVLQLGDFFLAGDEFILVIAGVAGFTVLSLAVLAIAYAIAPNAGLIACVALVLALVAVTPLALSGLIGRIADHSTNPSTIGMEKTAIALELIVPALLAVLVQWGLVRRRWLLAMCESDLSRWPWFTTAVATLVVLNPFGLAYLQSTLQHSATDWLSALTASITAGVLCALLVAAWIECYIRDRILNRHSAAVPSARDTTVDPFLQEARDAGNH